MVLVEGQEKERQSSEDAEGDASRSLLELSTSVTPGENDKHIRDDAAQEV